MRHVPSSKHLTLFLIAAVGVVVSMLVGYHFWEPGRKVTDGRHDRGRNAIWLQHGWIGDDAWFKQNRKDRARFRNVEALRNLAITLKDHNIKDLFPHLCPCSREGKILAVDAGQTELFLGELSGFRVMPWVGGLRGTHVFLESEEWKRNFITSVTTLLERHQDFAGIHLNVEPVPSGDSHFLRFLDELRQKLPHQKILSIAAHPPPTIWHPFRSTSWDRAYYEKVASRVDQLVVMMYDTSIRQQKIYRKLMASWTAEIIRWSGNTSVLLGLPVYDHVGIRYHSRRVENLENALLGVHQGLAGFTGLPENYQGIAIYSEWEMDSAEWTYLATEYVNQTLRVIEREQAETGGTLRSGG
jgi:hypothetical protein